MPLYEYTCRKCSKRFEQILFGREKAACPSCHGSDLQKMVSTFSAIGGESKSGSESFGGSDLGDSDLGGGSDFEGDSDFCGGMDGGDSGDDSSGGSMAGGGCGSFGDPRDPGSCAID